MIWHVRIQPCFYLNMISCLYEVLWAPDVCWSLQECESRPARDRWGSSWRTGTLWIRHYCNSNTAALWKTRTQTNTHTAACLKIQNIYDTELLKTTEDTHLWAQSSFLLLWNTKKNANVQCDYRTSTSTHRNISGSISSRLYWALYNPHSVNTHTHTSRCITWQFI